MSRATTADEWREVAAHITEQAARLRRHADLLDGEVEDLLGRAVALDSEGRES